MSAFDALERAFEGTRYQLDQDTPTKLSKQLDTRRYPLSYRRSVPVAHADIPSSDDETDSLQSRGSSSQRIVRQTITPPHLSRGNSGLPPTPPTMSSSGIIGRPREENTSPTPQFADAVRNALQSQKSGLSTPGIHLPTPEPSPPATSEEFEIQAPCQPPHLSRHPSSLHAESFHTARENASASQLHLPHTPSPEPVHPSQRDWTNRTREMRLRGVQMTVTSGSSTAPSRQRIYASSESDSSDSDDHDHELTPRRARQPQHTVVRRATPPMNGHLEKHISYGKDDFDAFDPYVDSAKQIDDIIPERSEASPVSVEDVNNLIYKHIQEENVKRHSAISDGSGLPVGIILAASEPREKKLKRTPRRETLRADASDDADFRRHSADIPLPLRYKKVDSSSASAAASPYAERLTLHRPLTPTGSTDSPSVMRQHTLRRSHNLERLERNSFVRNEVSGRMQSPPASSDRSRNVARAASQMSAERTLRHFSRGSHLENNVNVRRTSLHSQPDPPPTEVGVASAPLPLPHTLPKIRHGSPLHIDNVYFASNDHFSQHQTEHQNLSRKLRHFTADSKLENNAYNGRDTEYGIARAHLESSPHGQQQQTTTITPTRKLRHFTADAKLENNTSVRRTSLEHQASPIHDHSFGSTLSPASPRKSLGLDPYFLHPSTTPFSTSQMSDRTDIEVCEATGVNIYPHNNNSLLLIQHGSRPTSKDKAVPPPHNFLRMTDSQIGLNQPLFSAYVEQPSPKLGSSSTTSHADSPLINPRAAPSPPAFKVIPPTPVQELDCQLGLQQYDATAGERPGAPQRRGSLLQRARRYSESFVQPFFGRTTSVRAPRRAVDDVEQRPANLSPFWKPRNFWENFDSDEEVWDEDYDDEPPSSTLPRGGDTSEVREPKRILPRNMSVRMPGFRGNGGFLLGNSVGIDRHGSNNRRPHVSVGSSLRKRTSEEMLRRVSSSGRKRGFVLPFTVQYVGVRRFRERMSEIRALKEERQREKRRQVLRAQIQHAK